MTLKPLNVPPPYTLTDAAGSPPALVLATLVLDGTPKDLPIVPVIVAHVVNCFERPGEQAPPNGPITLTERGRGLLDMACTIYAEPAPGAPDEDRRRARAFVLFRREWASYLYALLSQAALAAKAAPAAPAAPAAKAAPETIVCPVTAKANGYRRLIEIDALPLLENDYFVLPWEYQTGRG